jgi:hypothetical protein
MKKIRKKNMFKFIAFDLFHYDFVVDCQYGRPKGRPWFLYESREGEVEVWIGRVYLTVSVDWSRKVS